MLLGFGGRYLPADRQASFETKHNYSIIFLLDLEYLRERRTIFPEHMQRLKLSCYFAYVLDKNRPYPPFISL